MLGNAEATQEEVDAAAKALKDAMDALVEIQAPEVDKSALTTVIAQAEALTASDYTEDSYAAVAEALAAAQTVLADAEATQEEVDAAVQALEDAMAQLVEVTDTAVLEALIGAAEALDASKYTEDSYAAMTEALEAAKASTGQCGSHSGRSGCGCGGFADSH